MFFLWRRNCKPDFDKQFLTYLECELNKWIACIVYSQKLPLVHVLNNLKNAIRRISLPPLLPGGVCRVVYEINLKAGISVEAALVMPLFIFFVLNLFSIMEMLRFHGNMAWALNEVGGKLAIYGYVAEQIEEEWKPGLPENVAISYLYIREEIADLLGKEYMQSAPLSEGEKGILFTEAKILEDDLIELTLTYQMKMPFLPKRLFETRVFHFYKARVWTGYDVAAEDDDMVYVTKNGEAYHVNETCKSLNIQKRQVHIAELETLRNESREIYDACSYCCTRGTEYVWITEEGRKYHETEECSALKRSVIRISSSRAKEEGYKLCNWCAEE